MTTEETELTFIRCPSCRSLVPAVATRCRMCGYSFESGAADGEESADSADASKSRSRVRQRTISATKEQMENAGSFDELSRKEADRVSAESTDPFMAAEANESAKASDVLESFSAAILPGDSGAAEVDAPGIVVDEPNLFEAEEQEATDSNADSGMFVDPAGTSDAEVEAAPETQAEAEPEVESEPESAESPNEEVQAVAETEGTEDEQEADSAASEEGKSSGRKRRRRKRKRRGGTEVSEQTEEQLNEKPAVNGARSTKASRSPAPAGETGVLVGWLVNFASDPKGESSELRSGKFFVGRQQLRKHDMVLDRDGVSTPHCMVSVADGQMQVQDLMSERGTYIQRSGSDSFDEISDIAEIEHGDRLKIGDYEVMVCLLPSD